LGLKRLKLIPIKIILLKEYYYKFNLALFLLKINKKRVVEMDNIKK